MIQRCLALLVALQILSPGTENKTIGSEVDFVAYCDFGLSEEGVSELCQGQLSIPLVHFTSVKEVSLLWENGIIIILKQDDEGSTSLFSLLDDYQLIETLTSLQGECEDEWFRRSDFSFDLAQSRLTGLDLTRSGQRKQVTAPSVLHTQEFFEYDIYNPPAKRVRRMADRSQELPLEPPSYEEEEDKGDEIGLYPEDDVWHAYQVNPFFIYPHPRC